MVMIAFLCGGSSVANNDGTSLLQPVTKKKRKKKVQTVSRAPPRLDEVEHSDLGRSSPVNATDKPMFDQCITADKATSSGKKSFRCRGHAKGISQWGSGAKFDILFNQLGHPIGKNASKLKSHFGQLCSSRRESVIWREVQDNILNVPTKFEKVCFEICGNMWRNHKSTTKSRYFTPFKNHPDILSQLPPTIVVDQWKMMVSYWLSENSQAIA